MPRDPDSEFSALRFVAMLRAARDFGLDQESVNAVALRFDTRVADLRDIADALADELLRKRPFALPDAA
jgi:hypothetical protein